MSCGRLAAHKQDESSHARVHVVFADTSWGVSAAREILRSGNAQLVALSVEAFEAANALAIACRPIGDLASGWRNV